MSESEKNISINEENISINEENNNTDIQISNTDIQISNTDIQISNTDTKLDSEINNSKLSNKPTLKRRNAIANFELTESYQEFIKQYKMDNDVENGKEK